MILTRAPLVLAALSALVMTLLSAERGPSATTIDEAPAVAAAQPRTAETVPAEQPAPHPGLIVHVQLPSALAVGGTRQLRVQTADAAGAAGRSAELVAVELEASAPGVLLQPTRAIVSRAEMHRTRFAIGLSDGVGCQDDLGRLVVRVRTLSEEPAQGTVEVAIPSPDCGDGPPAAPETVHVTEPVCGPEWREEVERIIDGEWLDPRRCSGRRYGSWDRPVRRAAPPPPVEPEEPEEPEEPDPASEEDPDSEPVEPEEQGADESASDGGGDGDGGGDQESG